MMTVKAAATAPINPPPFEPPLVDFKDAMKLLAISDRALRRELLEGNIAAKFRGRKVLFEPSELRRYVADLRSWEPSK
jgi:hypothetical protein